MRASRAHRRHSGWARHRHGDHRSQDHLADHVIDKRPLRTRQGCSTSHGWRVRPGPFGGLGPCERKMFGASQSFPMSPKGDMADLRADRRTVIGVHGLPHDRLRDTRRGGTVGGRPDPQQPLHQHNGTHRPASDRGRAGHVRLGSTIVSAFQVGRIADGGVSDVGWAVSHDGGHSWSHGFLPAALTPSSTTRTSAIWSR